MIRSIFSKKLFEKILEILDILFRWSSSLQCTIRYHTVPGGWAAGHAAAATVLSPEGLCCLNIIPRTEVTRDLSDPSGWHTGNPFSFRGGCRLAGRRGVVPYTVHFVGAAPSTLRNGHPEEGVDLRSITVFGKTGREYNIKYRHKKRRSQNRPVAGKRKNDGRKTVVLLCVGVDLSSRPVAR